MTNKHQAYLFLHISVVLWGFTAILGALISLSAVVLVWYRVVATTIFLLFWPGMIRKLCSLSRKDVIRFAIIGFLVGLHWICFYGSIKLANASIALVALSTSALFTAFIEPLVFRQRIDRADIILSLLVIPAMILTTHDFDEGKIVGLWVGIAAAFLIATFGVLNKRYLTKSDTEVITFIEISSSAILLTLISPLLFSFDSTIVLNPTFTDWIYLIILSLFCTILPFVLHLKSLKYISAFTSNLATNLEPVYGIILAVFFLNENRELNTSFYMGVLIIVSIIMVHPYLKNNQKKLLKSIDDFH